MRKNALGVLFALVLLAVGGLAGWHASEARHDQFETMSLQVCSANGIPHYGPYEVSWSNGEAVVFDASELDDWNVLPQVNSVYDVTYGTKLFSDDRVVEDLRFLGKIELDSNGEEIDYDYDVAIPIPNEEPAPAFKPVEVNPFPEADSDSSTNDMPMPTPEEEPLSKSENDDITSPPPVSPDVEVAYGFADHCSY